MEKQDTDKTDPNHDTYFIYTIHRKLACRYKNNVNE